jgi:hypothetical protein
MEPPQRRPTDQWLKTIVLVGVVLVLTVAACSEPESITGAIEANQIAELDSVEELQVRFNSDTATPRLIMLLSPT